MKALSIGREQGCDIVINDNTDVISRRHATLNISSSGKITIVDQSRNGTYVNGIRISSNVPVPISRKDIISFAHVTKLNWDTIPKTNSTMRYVIMGAIGILIVVCSLVVYQYIPHNSSNDKKGEAIIADSIKKPEEKKDSTYIKKERNIEKKDSTNTNKQKKRKKQEEKKQENEKKHQPIAPKDPAKNNRPIG